jgi:hypothetical protein
LSIISFIVYLLLFTFTFLPQYLFMLIFQGPASAFINTTVLVLGEGQVIIQALFEGFFVDECQVDIFDVSFAKSLTISEANSLTCVPRPPSSTMATPI